MVSATIFVEGGGDSKDTKIRCREGFRDFLRKSGLEGRMPRIVACGGRKNAYDDFCTALARTSASDIVLLLVDSEGPVGASSPWMHLNERDGWARPDSATDDNVHLMVQCMESWFLADKDCLREHFGARFNSNALPRNPAVEAVPKQDALNGLKEATRPCGVRRRYHKGRDSFAVLATLDPKLVAKASPHAKRLLDFLAARLKPTAPR